MVTPGLAGARQLLVTAAFDLILVDFDLDDGKGDELVAELCKQPTSGGSARSSQTSPLTVTAT